MVRNMNFYSIRLKKVLSSFIYLHLIPNVFDCFFGGVRKERILQQPLVHLSLCGKSVWKNISFYFVLMCRTFFI